MLPPVRSVGRGLALRPTGSGLGPLQHGQGLDDESYRSILIIEQVGGRRLCDSQCALALRLLARDLSARRGRSSSWIRSSMWSLRRADSVRTDSSNGVRYGHDHTSMEDAVAGA